MNSRHPRSLAVFVLGAARPLLVALVVLLAPGIARGDTFTDVTSGPLGDTNSSLGVGWGDYDQDGDLDLYLTNYGQANKLFRNEGGGTFVDATSGPLGDPGYSTGAVWGDYDNDGDLDLYLANDGSANRLFRNEGGGTFVDATLSPMGDTGSGLGVAWGDYDNDGDLDLYLVNNGSANKLFRNNGSGAFVEATSSPLDGTGFGYGAAWGDYDNDGDLDLYLVNNGSANKLFRNDGGGAFVDATSGPLGDTGLGYGVAWGDYDNDGDLDLYLVNYGSANKLFRNDGGGTFVDATSGPLGGTGDGTGVAWGDYDNDGDLDLYLVNYGSANKLFRNDGGGTFADATSGPLGDTSLSDGVAWGDYDQDGDLDLYLANSDQANKLFRNEVGTANHWLHVDLRGTVSNRSGIGARVRVVAGGVTRIEEISGGSGSWSQNSLTAEFGLGSNTAIDLLEIRWPSGIVQVVSPTPAVDQAILVVEAPPPSCQFASAVIAFSSQDGLGDYSAAQALGPPNVYPLYGDSPQAWSSATQNGQPEYLILGFSDPVYINHVNVYETLAPGAITFIGVKNPGTGFFEPVWTGTASSAPPVSRIFTAVFDPKPYPVSEVVVYLDSPAVADYNMIDAVAIGYCDLAAERQWASGVLDVSSEYSPSPGDWSADQALGPPDVYPAYGDFRRAWASQSTDDQREYLELSYATPQVIDFVSVVETFNPGALDTVLVKNPGTGKFEVVWSRPAVPAPTASRILNISFPATSFLVSEVRLEFDSPAVPDWNEVDAVAIGRCGCLESLVDVPSVTNTPIANMIEAAQPNPFTNSARIGFALSGGGRVKVEIFNALGQSVTRLVDGTLPAGRHEIQWDGRDASGRGVAAGVYYVAVTAKDFRATRKLVKLR